MPTPSGLPRRRTSGRSSSPKSGSNGSQVSPASSNSASMTRRACSASPILVRNYLLECKSCSNANEQEKGTYGRFSQQGDPRRQSRQGSGGQEPPGRQVRRQLLD